MKKVGLAVAGLIALIAILGFYPFIHNYYVFSLGRLRGNIALGDPADTVAAKFREYVADHGDHDCLQFVEKSTDRHPSGRTMEPALLLFLYDCSVFDDIQLGAIIREGRLAEIYFIGD